MECNSEQAEILIKALPYIKKYAGKTVVVKYGGNAMTNDVLKESVMKDIVLLRYVGMQPVLVHGGGPDITEMMAKMGKEPAFVGGLRVTDAETMEIVEMALSGKTNKGLVSILNRQGGKAVGLSGKDGNLLVARKKMPGGKDIGFVGDVTEINPGIIESLIEADYIPVICSVAAGEQGETFNINADHAAGAIAAKLGACKLLMLTDVEGVYRDFSDKSSLISTLPIDEAKALIASGVIDKGMIPKIESCITAIEGGVDKAHIINGTTPHAIIMEVLTDTGIGTMII